MDGIGMKGAKASMPQYGYLALAGDPTPGHQEPLNECEWEGSVYRVAACNGWCHGRGQGLSGCFNDSCGPKKESGVHVGPPGVACPSKTTSQNLGKVD
jgi:hypothetical protein